MMYWDDDVIARRLTEMVYGRSARKAASSSGSPATQPWGNVDMDGCSQQVDAQADGTQPSRRAHPACLHTRPWCASRISPQSRATANSTTRHLLLGLGNVLPVQPGPEGGVGCRQQVCMQNGSARLFAHAGSRPAIRPAAPKPAMRSGNGSQDARCSFKLGCTPT